MTVTHPLDLIRGTAIRLGGVAGDYDALLESVGDRPLVLLGEATHGTREFYRMRAEITLRLIREKAFDAVAVEADWPDAYRLNRYVRGEDGGADAEEAFGDFQRFPVWMWRNEEVLRFVRELRDINASRAPEGRIGFYGLDMYSLYRSSEAVIAYLDDVDQEQAALAREQYATLDHVRDPQRYGYEAVSGLRPDARAVVQERLNELLRRAPAYLELDGRPAADAFFFAERNAQVVKSAEAYYRAMFGSRAESWNLRDRHMVETLFALQSYLRKQERPGRVVVWAHNSHLGDARATEMSRAGEWNVGQLVREALGPQQAFLVGFTTSTGTVTAAHDWGGEAESRKIRVALPESYEGLFQRTRLQRFYLPLGGPVGEALKVPMLERAIGVLYLPQTERWSHYFDVRIADQLDAVIHIDDTRALEPLERTARWERGELPETYPTGL